ncbi:Cyclin N-terminal domain-containing protein [Meloidogyne graminicola]|uniref:Cyclin N-terminal domain-containing protein n=1 Tax=Meloidogyne graminicola TaxID=189291 RepID=A0A8S9ZQJ8_9BILA|nr:Cyclin N-terminal domain-containing protein [Meloidogyne graminicola]
MNNETLLETNNKNVFTQNNSALYTLSRVLLNSLLFKSTNECNELKKHQKHQYMEIDSFCDRDKQVKWILMLGRRFRLGLSTVGLSIAILDKIMRMVKVQGKYLHCLAVSALGLAVKFHEELDAESEAFETNRAAAIILAIPSPEPLTSDELASEIRAQSEFSQKELNRMERTLLSRLNWDLLLPSFDRFLSAMLAVIGTPHLAVSRILRRNFELIISNGRLVWSYSSSVLALSTLSVMLEFTTVEWRRITQSLTNIFQIDTCCLLKCREEAGELLRKHYWIKSRQKPLHYNILIPLMPAIITENNLDKNNQNKKKRHFKEKTTQNNYFENSKKIIK